MPTEGIDKTAALKQTFELINSQLYAVEERIRAQARSFDPAVEGYVGYAIESPSPNLLSRSGWTSASLKPGDRVKITIQPLRDGSKGGSFVRGLFPNGRTLTLAG